MVRDRRKLQPVPPLPNHAPSGEGPAAAVAGGAQCCGRGKIDRSKYETVTDLARLEAWVAEAREAGGLAFDTETTQPRSHAGRVRRLLNRGGARARPATCRSGIASAAAASTSARATSQQVPIGEALAVLKPLLEDAVRS